MRMLTQMSEPMAAMQFSSYLIARGIPNQLEQTESGVALWILNEDQLPLASEELAVFQSNPNDRRFDAAKQASAILREQAKKQERLRAKHVDVRTSWAKRSIIVRKPVVTYILIGICVVVYVLQMMRGPMKGKAEQWLMISSPTSAHQVIVDDPESGFHLVEKLDFAPEIFHGQVWRLITPIFLHFNPIHILFNMLWLWNLGRLVEHFRGPWRLLGIVLISAIISNLAQYVMQVDIRGFDFGLDPYFGGFSGVVYALFGYCWMRGKYYPEQGIFMPPNILQMMIIWLVLCMVMTSLNVANTAHLFGLLAGMGIGYIPGKIKRMKRKWA